MSVGAQPGKRWFEVRSAARAIAGIDRPAWRRFILALFALILALFLALYATALSQSGQYKGAAAMAVFSLLLTALVAVRVVPGLARRTALRHWMTGVEYKLTRQGVIYLAMISVITVAALNTGNNLLFIILSCLLAGILASGVMSRIVLQGLELDLSLPEHVFAEQPVIARLRLQNRKEFLPTFSVIVSGQRASRRRPGIPKSPPRPVILTQDVYVPYLPRRSSVQQDVKLTFARRGRYSQESLRISTRFPFRFVRKTRNVACGREVLVLPNVQPGRKFLELLPLIGSELDSYLKGRSHDLYAIRDYQQSDSARHVDWKATARVQQLKVREFTREDERRIRLVFDRRVPSTGAKTLEQFEKAVNFCACLTWYLYETGATMSFVTDGFETPISLAGQILYPVLEKLAVIEPAPAQGPSPAYLFERSHAQEQSFQIILTHQPVESFPAERQRSTYFVRMDAL